MKPNDTTEDDRRLREVLATWQVSATSPPRFQERVWQRVERRDSQPAAGPWAQLLQEIAAALSRPRLAVSYVTLLLAGGLLAGLWQAHATNERVSQNLSARYVQMLESFQTPHAEP